MLATIFTGGPRDEGRLVTVHAILSGRTTLTGQIYDDMDKEVHSTILNLLREFQSDGYFLEDVEIEPLARLMYNAVNGVFYRWLGDDIMTHAQSFDQRSEQQEILRPPTETKTRQKHIRMQTTAI